MLWILCNEGGFVWTLCGLFYRSLWLRCENNQNWWWRLELFQSTWHHNTYTLPNHTFHFIYRAVAWRICWQNRAILGCLGLIVCFKAFILTISVATFHCQHCQHLMDAVVERQTSWILVCVILYDDTKDFLYM